MRWFFVCVCVPLVFLEMVVVVGDDDAAGQDDEDVREDVRDDQDEWTTASPSPNFANYHFSMIGPNTSSCLLPMTELLPHLGCGFMWGDARHNEPPLHPPHLTLLEVRGRESWCLDRFIAPPLLPQHRIDIAKRSIAQC